MARPVGSKNKVPGIQKRAWEKKSKRVKSKIAKTRAKRIQQKSISEFLDKEDAARVELGEPIAILKQQIYNLQEANPLAWAHFYFPHHFTRTTPRFHIDIMRALLQSRFVNIAAPRGSAKSTEVNFIYVFHRIRFQKCHFIVIGSATFTKAAMYLETIKQELRENQLLRSSFREPIEIVKDAEGDSEFRHPNGFVTKVICKGRDQIGSIRGVKFGAHRPDLMIWDDVEDDKMVENPDLRVELQNLYDQAWVPAGEKDRTQYVNIGTILQDDSQMAKFVVHREVYPEYTKLFFQAHLFPDTSQETSLWPEKWSVEWLRQLRKDDPLTYAKEYQNDPVAGPARKFDREDIRYWELVDNRYLLLDPQHKVIGSGTLAECKGAIAVDLAWEEKRQHDYSVIMPGFLTPTSELLIDQYVMKKGLRPDEAEEILFSMVVRMEQLTGGRVPVGMEKAKLEKVVRWFMKQAMKRRNDFFTVKDLLWDMDKHQRIEVRLSARYAQHVIFHRVGLGELEEQLVRFPSGAHDDLLDAEQGLVQLLQHSKQAAPQQPAADRFMQVRQWALEAKTARQSKRGMFSITAPQYVRQHLPVHVDVLH